MFVSNYRHDRWVVAGFLNAVQVKLDQSLPCLNQVTLRNFDVKALAEFKNISNAIQVNSIKHILVL